MPRLIDTDAGDAIDVGDLVEMLNAGPFDAEDDDCIAAWGPALKRLANNRRFLGDLMIAELKQRCAGQLASNHYSAQVILLHRGAKKFVLRANFWPAEEDSVLVNSGRSPFFYDLPHDHNFSFLTVGYWGPGYWSDYYDYDHDRVFGCPDEPVDLRFVERLRLEEGRVLLYRRHRDVHAQLPPDALSVSLNILAASPGMDFRHQYQFDVGRSAVTRIVNHSALATLVRLAALCGGENGRDLVEHFAGQHPCDRTRFAALQAKASLVPDMDARIGIYDKAGHDQPGLVGALARHEAERARRTRGWIESAPDAVRPTAL